MLQAGDYVRCSPDLEQRFSRPYALGPWQKQLILGGLIGDLGFTETKTTARVRIVHGIKQLEYFIYKVVILKSLIRQKNVRVKTEFSPKVGIVRTCTVSSPELKRIYTMWQEDLPGFLACMDDRGWAFAYMDDGGMDGKLFLNGMPEKRAIMICEAFNARFRTRAFIRDEKGPVMVINREDMRTFTKRCGTFFHPSMRYKIKTDDPFCGGFCDSKPYALLRVADVRSEPYKGLRYNLEVARNHNYVVDHGVLVSNCHHMKAPTHQAVFEKSKAVYRFGLSGTVPAENTYDGWLVRQNIGDVVFNISNKELIEQGVSAEPMIYMIKHQHCVDYEKLRTEIRAEDTAKNKTYASPWKEKEEVHKRVFSKVVQQQIVRNVVRNQVVVDKVCGEYRDKQVLIVVDFIEQGRLLADMLGAKKDESDTMDFIHGEAESRMGSLLAFRKGTLRVLISSSIIDEGIDISRIQLLVLAGGKKSKRQILQRIGRGLRRKVGENLVHILDFFDFDGKYLAAHSKERLKLYNAEGFHVEIVEADEKLNGQKAV